MNGKVRSQDGGEYEAAPAERRFKSRQRAIFSELCIACSDAKSPRSYQSYSRTPAR